MKWLFILLFVAAGFTETLFGAKTNPPLVLQYQVSHPRNVDQISLIFRKKLHLVVNTSSFQKSKSVRLGRFTLPMNRKLFQLKAQIQAHYNRLSQTISLLEYMNFDDERMRVPVSPHAVILGINDEEIHDSSPYFETFVQVIYDMWDKPWKCLECATYTKRGNNIVRVTRKWDKKQKSKNRYLRQRKVYSRSQLKCYERSKDALECVDPEYGIFEL